MWNAEIFGNPFMKPEISYVKSVSDLPLGWSYVLFDETETHWSSVSVPDHGPIKNITRVIPRIMFFIGPWSDVNNISKPNIPSLIQEEILRFLVSRTQIWRLDELKS